MVAPRLNTTVALTRVELFASSTVRLVTDPGASASLATTLILALGRTATAFRPGLIFVALGAAASGLLVGGGTLPPGRGGGTREPSVSMVSDQPPRISVKSYALSSTA